MVIEMKRGKRLFGIYGIAYFLVKHNSYCGIDRILFALPASAENDARRANLFALNRCYVT
jgi:hypothetical protein